MINIKVIFPGPQDPSLPIRKLEDLLPYQDEGVKLHLGFNRIGALHCSSNIEEAYAVAGMAEAATLAEQEGMDAIVIESMGDTGLLQCREAVNIPVVGMADVSLRLASMLGRRFGLITAGDWHGYAIERLITLYRLDKQYLGYEKLDAQPFFLGNTDVNQLHTQIVSSMIKLINIGADTIVLGGSYFLGKAEMLSHMLEHQGHTNITVLDPLPNAIRFARFMANAGLKQSKLIYKTPVKVAKVVGY